MSVLNFITEGRGTWAGAGMGRCKHCPAASSWLIRVNLAPAGFCPDRVWTLEEDSVWSSSEHLEALFAGFRVGDHSIL